MYAFLTQTILIIRKIITRRGKKGIIFSWQPLFCLKPSLLDQGCGGCFVDKMAENHSLNRWRQYHQNRISVNGIWSASSDFRQQWIIRSVWKAWILSSLSSTSHCVEKHWFVITFVRSHWISSNCFPAWSQIPHGETLQIERQSRF